MPKRAQPRVEEAREAAALVLIEEHRARRLIRRRAPATAALSRVTASSH